MRVYDLIKREWTLLELDDTPNGCEDVLLDAFDGQLIQYGGMCVAVALANIGVADQDHFLCLQLAHRTFHGPSFDMQLFKDMRWHVKRITE